MIFDQLFRPTIENPPCFKASGFDRADAVDSLSYFHHDSPKNNWRWWWWRGGLLHNVIDLINVSHSLMASLKLLTRQVSVKWQLMQRRTVSFYSGLVLRNWGLLFDRPYYKCRCTGVSNGPRSGKELGLPKSNVIIWRYKKIYIYVIIF